MRELVDDGIDGLRVPPGDAGALADAIAALVRDPGAALELGRAARKRMEAAHDPDDHVDALLDCYRDAAARAS